MNRREEFGFELVWINEPFKSLEDIAAELENDVVLGATRTGLRTEGEYLIFADGSSIRFSQFAKPEEIHWKNEVEWIFECSGKFTDRNEAARHLRWKIDRVFISATSMNADNMVILGLNEKNYNVEQDKIISYGSCTINGFMPIAGLLEKKFGITEAGLNVTHNTPLKDIKNAFSTILRRTCTLEYVGPILMPVLKDRFFVNYHLVTYPGVSLMDLQF